MVFLAHLTFAFELLALVAGVWFFIWASNAHKYKLLAKFIGLFVVIMSLGLMVSTTYFMYFAPKKKRQPPPNQQSQQIRPDGQKPKLQLALPPSGGKVKGGYIDKMMQQKKKPKQPKNSPEINQNTKGITLPDITVKKKQN